MVIPLTSTILMSTFIQSVKNPQHNIDVYINSALARTIEKNRHNLLYQVYFILWMKRLSDKNWSGSVKICISFYDLKFTEIVIVGLGYWRKPNLNIILYPNESISRQLDSIIFQNSQLIYLTKIS